jgi:hypothetical protein
LTKKQITKDEPHLKQTEVMVQNPIAPFHIRLCESLIFFEVYLQAKLGEVWRGMRDEVEFSNWSV